MDIARLVFILTHNALSGELAVYDRRLKPTCAFTGQLLGTLRGICFRHEVPFDLLGNNVEYARALPSVKIMSETFATARAVNTIDNMLANGLWKAYVWKTTQVHTKFQPKWLSTQAHMKLLCQTSKDCDDDMVWSLPDLRL